MNKFRINKTFSFFQKKFSNSTLSYSHRIKFHSKKRLFLEKKSFSLFYDEIVLQQLTHKSFLNFFTYKKILFSRQKLCCLANETKMSISEPFFFNFSFDKSRLKNIVSWFFEKYGQYKTILFLERLKEFGFGYATMGGISLGIDDLKIPQKKIALISTSETKVAKDLMDYRNAKITGIERTQRLIYIWNQTNDMLKQEVLKYFETMDLFNPIYMMAFSGARGNMSQVRQLVGMRGLMSDPQGQIIDFPIQSNFREGLTLTEYLISTYGARKGIVDTALRTATAGYLTRRLVDVAQHVIVSQFDCGTFRGIFLFDMKEANKTIYSFQNRLIGRVLAQDVFISKESKANSTLHKEFAQRQAADSEKVVLTESEKTLLAARNQEIDSKLAFAIAKISKKALVRSPLTCETPRLICQLCYGWSLSQGKLVSIGDAVGVIAAQSIGEPGTQLTMRTFHTGGVFAGGLTDQILAPFDGRIQYVQNIPGSCIRTSLSEIAFLTKMPGFFFVVRKGQNKDFFDLYLKSINYEKDLSNLQTKWKKMQNVNVSEMYKIPAYAVLYLRNNEIVRKNQVLAQFSTVLKKSFQFGSAEQTLYSNLAGEFILNGLHFPIKKTLSKVFHQNLKNLAIDEKATDIMLYEQLHTKNEKFADTFSNLPIIDRLSSITKKNLKKIDLLVEKRSSEFLELSPIELKHDVLWKSKNWTNIWILSGKIIYHPFHSNLFIEKGDFLKKTSVLNRILWKKKKNWNISLFTTKFTSIENKSFIEKRKNLFFLLVLNKKNKFNSLSSNLFSPFKNLFSSFTMLRRQLALKLTSVIFLKKTNYFNTETFFVEQDFKKTNIEKFCSFLFSSSTFSFVQVFVKNSETRKKSFFSNLNIHWKNSSSCIQAKIENKQIFYKTKYLPFSLFFFKILSSSEQDLLQNKKLNKTKSDILFSKTFKKIFSFSYLQKQQNLSKKLFVNKIVYTSSKNNQKKIFRIKLLLQKNNNRYRFNQKKHLKQIFFKFSTFHRTISFFRFSSFSKTFNISRKFVKMKSGKNFLISKKKFLLFKLSYLKDNPNILLKKSKQLFATKQFFHEYKKISNKNLSSLTVESKSNSQIVLRTHFQQQDKQQFVEQKNKQLLQKFIFPSRLKLSFFKSFMFKNSKISQNFEQSQNFKENRERHILFKKTLLSFDYKKIRYNKYGYVFSFHNSLKNKSFTTQIENSFQIFTKLKQSFFDFKNMSNPGKQQTNISFANGNFIGKDFPTFLTYFFPKNYQTMTNGIFTILSFENHSKKQRYKQFCCLQQRKNSLFLKDYSKKSRKKKKKSSFLQKKVGVHMSTATKEKTKLQYSIFSRKFKFLQNQSFHFVNKKMHFNILNIFKNSIQKNILNYKFVQNSKQKEFDKTVSLLTTHSFKNQKVFLSYDIKKSVSLKKTFVLLKYLKKYNFRRFSRSELYTEEIFWIPQENYTFPILDFYKLQPKSFIYNKLLTRGLKTDYVSNNLFLHSLHVSSNSKTIIQNKKNEYISKIILKKNPLFYLSNSQGKKKPFFSVLEGIWNYSISSNKLKYRQFSYIQHKKFLMTKQFYKIQQKLSFYKLKKEKTFKKNFSKLFLKKSSVKFLKLQKLKFLNTLRSKSFFNNHRRNFIFFYRDKNAALLPKVANVIQNNNFLFFFKKKNFLNILSKFYFEKKFKQTIQKNFLFGLHKKIESSNFENIKNLFFSEFKKPSSYKKTHKKTSFRIFHKKLKKFIIVKKATIMKKSTSLHFSSFHYKKLTQNNLSERNSWKFSNFTNIQKKVGKILKNQCFTCVPFKKTHLVKKHIEKLVNRRLTNSFASDLSFSPNFELNQMLDKKQEKSNKSNDSLIHSVSQNMKNLFLLQNQQLHLKIQSGWICVFPNSSHLFHSHPQIMNIGHFFGKDFCFEQNKILKEIVIFEVPSSFSDIDFQKSQNFNTIPFSNGNKTLKEKAEKNMNSLNLYNSKNTKISFCFKSIKKNKKSRFSNDSSIFASQILNSLFAQKTISETVFFEDSVRKPSSLEKTFLPFSMLTSQKKKQINNNFHLRSFKTNVQKQKKIALFFRPMQYRLLENPKNYKKVFLKKTFENNSTRSDCISFVSSLKIYKKYHSIILNIQKPNKKFIQNIENIDSIIKTDFRKIYKKKKWQKNQFSTKQKIFFISNKKKYNRAWSTQNQQKQHTVFKFDFLKNLTKIPHFQLYSKNTMFFKFQNLLTRNKSILFNSDTHSQTIFPFTKKTLSAEQTLHSSTLKKNTENRQNTLYLKLPSQRIKLATIAKTNCIQKMFFSFYPIQFVPLSISNSSLNTSYFEHKNSQIFPTLFLNSLNNKIDFSICHKKAAFLNQRFYSFDFLNKFIQTSSFWLNNDSKNSYFIYSIKKNLFKNFWNMSFFHSFSSIYMNESAKATQLIANQKLTSQYKQNSLKKKRLLFRSNIHIKSSMFKNYLFQNNQNFYANTQFLSPFDGELISMYTNELNWWKKASEISTIQKLNTLFTVITTKDLFSFDFSNPFKNKKNRKKSIHTIEIKDFLTDNSKKSLLVDNTILNSDFIFEKQKSSFSESNSNKFLENSMKYCLKTKQKHLNNLYKFVMKNQSSFACTSYESQQWLNFAQQSSAEQLVNQELTSESLNSFFKTSDDSVLSSNSQEQKKCEKFTSQFSRKNFSVNKIIKTKKFVLLENQNKTKHQISSFVTKYENKIYKLQNLIVGYPSVSKQPRLGKFLVAGDCILNFAIRKPGQIVHFSLFKVTLRRGQPFLVSPKGILHLANTPYIEKNVPILTLPYQTLQSGDIVQGIPKVEQYFEARTTIQGRLFISSLPILLKGIFQRYKSMFPLEQAVRQSFLKIQQLIVDGVQRVYRLQGVSIVDKHLEVIVRQMTTKVQIIHGAQTGFFPGELVNLHLVERINKLLLVKVRYEPIVLGITRASLEVDSFLSASSFQQTTKILALASISRKKDFLKGLKENILVGNVIPSGTGYLILGKHL